MIIVVQQSVSRLYEWIPIVGWFLMVIGLIGMLISLFRLIRH